MSHEDFTCPGCLECAGNRCPECGHDSGPDTEPDFTDQNHICDMLETVYQWISGYCNTITEHGRRQLTTSQILHEMEHYGLGGAYGNCPDDYDHYQLNTILRIYVNLWKENNL